MSTANRVIKNTGYLYAKMGVTMFISLYTTRLLLNSLGASDFGIFNVVGGAIAMLGFLNAAMAGATQRFMSYVEGEGKSEKKKNVFNISVILHLAIAIVLGLVLLVAGYFFFNDILNIPADRVYPAKVVYGSMIISTMFTVMSVPYDAVLNAHENMLYYSIIGIVESLLKLFVALLIVFWSSGDKLILYGILMACIPLVIMTTMRIYCHKKYQECIILPKKYWDKQLFREMMGFASWNFWGSTVGMVSNYGQGIVINMFFGPIVNASQGIAGQINGQISVFSATMLKALNPVITKSEGQGNRKNVIKATVSGSKFSFFLLVLFAVPVFIEMPYILDLWIIEVPDFSIVFCRLLIIISLIDQMFITLPSAISATGKIKAYQISVSILAVLPLIVSYFLFQKGFPSYYMYIIFIIQRLLRGFGIILFFSKKILNISLNFYFKEVIIKCLSIAFIMAIFSSLLGCFLEENFYRLVLTFFISTTVFVLAVIYIGMSKDERENMFIMIHNLKNKLSAYRNPTR